MAGLTPLGPQAPQPSWSDIRDATTTWPSTLRFAFVLAVFALCRATTPAAVVAVIVGY